MTKKVTGRDPEFFTIMHSLRRVNCREDMDFCINIRFKVFVEEQKCDPQSELDHFDESSDTIYWLVRRDDLPAGTVRCAFTDGGCTAKIGRLAVLKEHRGKGLGARVLKAIENDVRQNCPLATKFLLHSQQDKTGFYEKCGYKIVEPGNVFLEENIPHLKMTKSIK